MAKCSAPGCRAKSGPIFNVSRKAKTVKGLPRNALCALCLLFAHPLVFIPGGSKGKGESIFYRSIFFVFTKKKLCGLRVLCG
jgi:hypothetical protein